MKKYKWTYLIIGFFIIKYGFQIFLSLNYWDVDIDRKYECVSFSPYENEVQYLDVIIKGKYEESKLRGDRFTGTVTVDNVVYPDMLSEIDDPSLSVTNAHRYTEELAKNNPISQKIEDTNKMKGFKVGYDYGSKLWYKYGSYGYIYFDDDMENIIITVSYEEAAISYSENDYIEKIISSQNNVFETKNYIRENLRYLDLYRK